MASKAVWVRSRRLIFGGQNMLDRIRGNRICDNFHTWFYMRGCALRHRAGAEAKNTRVAAVISEADLESLGPPWE
jgi:hypothetical protein